MGSTQPNTNTFRWAIIGTGVVSRKFVLDLRHADSAKAAIVASRNPENAKRFSKDLSVPIAAKSYEEAINNPDIDAVYIATPPTEHYKLTIDAIHAGKAVLVEKPFTTSLEEANAIFKLAKEKNIFVMEAMWTRFHPTVQHIRKLIQAGCIGEPKSFTGRFCIANAVDNQSNIFNLHLGGGALLHRGIYPLSLASFFLGKPTFLNCSTQIGKTEVDEDTVLVTRHGNALATTFSSLCTTTTNNCQITGTKGTIDISAPIFRPFQYTISPTTQRESSKSYRTIIETLKESSILQKLNQLLKHPYLESLHNLRKTSVIKMYNGNGYHYQANEVSRLSRLNAIESPTMPHHESLQIVGILEKARTNWNRQPSNKY